MMGCRAQPPRRLPSSRRAACCAPVTSSKASRSDGTSSASVVLAVAAMVDALLATAVLTGLALNAGLGWWWADPLAGYVILFYGLKEGIAALQAH